jgi:transposase-like protein
MFWQELEDKNLKEAQEMIQSKIYEEFDMQIGASRYERAPGKRADDRNGYRFRSYEIANGYVCDLKIPRARKLDIRFTVFDMWERVQPKVLSAMLKTALLARSSSSAQNIIEAFGHSRFSKGFLQKLVKRYEDNLKRYLTRPLTKRYEYIFIDGMVVKIHDVYLKDKIVLFAMGMDKNKHKEILGWAVVNSEDENAVRSLLLDLKGRGLKAPDLFITDESKGIIAALKLEYTHVKRQLCAFHKVNNIQANLTNMSNRKAIMREAMDIYKLSYSRKEAVKRFKLFRSHWKKKEYEAVRLFSRNFEDTLTYFEFPKEDRISIYTTNPMEQFIGKIRDWTTKFNYFRGQANLELTIYTYLCYKNEGLVLEEENSSYLPKYTFFIA